MIHRFVDQVSVGVFPYQRMYFVGGASYTQLWAVPWSGGAPVQLTSRTSDGDEDLSPDVSPDGSMVAFVRGTGFGSYKLYVINADGTGLTLLDNTAGCAAPAWHPDGSVILYRRSNGFRTVEPDGSNNQGITISPAPTVGWTLRCAAWNYDGSLIAFHTDDGLSGVVNQVWVMNADGTGAAQVATTNNTGSPMHSWARSQNRLAHSKTISSANALVAIDEDGSNSTTLRNPSDGVLRHAWSADDSKVIHAVGSAMHAANADGSGSTSLGLTRLLSGITGPLVVGGRIYVVRGTTQDLVSTAIDGSDLRVEDTPDLVGPDFLDLRLLDGGGTNI